MDLILLAVLGGAMTWSMLRRPAQPFFRPVGFAFLPLLIMISPLMWGDGWTQSPEVMEAKRTWAEQVAQLPVPEGVTEEAFRQNLDKVLYWMVFFIPGGTLVLWLGALTLLAWVIRRSLAARGKVVPAPPLSLWRAPEWLIWLFLFPALAALAVVNDWVSDPEQAILRAGGNWIFLIASVYLFQGVQVMRWRLTRAKSPWIVWVALGLAFVALGMGAFVSLGVTLAMIGILDLWLDFRRLVTPESKDGSQGGKA
jgi:hypothetical protein